jgi:translation initiation factor 1 (eIF-1/SUI1)
MDELWMLHQNVPNEGFCIDEVIPLKEFLPQEESKEEEKSEVSTEIISTPSNKDDNQTNDEIPKIIETIENSQNSLKIKENSEKELNLIEKNENPNNLVDLVDEVPGSAIFHQDSSAVSASETLSEEIKDPNPSEPSESLKTSEEKPFLNQSPDEIILEIFLTCIHVAITAEDLPLEPSTLLSYMNRCKRSYILDFSQTSFKKIGKFLQHASKLGLIEYQKPKNFDHKLITSINKSHKLLQDFVPIVKKMKNIESTSEEEKILNYPKIVFTSGLVPKYEFHDFFSFVLPDRPRVVLQKSEVNSLLSKYLAGKGLESSKKTVKLDAFLQKTLKCSEEINKSEFFIKGRNLFNEGYLAEYSSGLLPAFITLGPLPSITITVSKGKGKHRKIMNVAGCDSYLIDMDELQTLCQKTFSATSSVLKSEKKNCILHELQMFGDHSEKLPKILIDFFKVPASVIVVKNLA